MAYNNIFPATYQQYYPQQYQPQQYPQQVQPQAQNNNSIIWVQGEAGAKSYMVAPNTTVQLWDSEAQVIYLKSADASGMPSIKTLDYTIRELPRQTNENGSNLAFATIDEVNTIKAKLSDLRKEFEAYGKSSLRYDESKSAE